MKQTDRVPHKARGAAQSAGVPAERAGVPAESAGTTKTSYPLMKYLSLLLAVALLFSGVTFARYLSNDRIDSSVGIAAFDATYSIDRVNTTSFGNQAYWIETGNSGYVPQGENTAITVGITLKNNGDTDVHPTLHLEGPADYWDNIALQFSTSRNIAADSVLTPQFVIADLVKERQEAPGDAHDITYGEYKDWGTSGSFDTSASDDFDPLGDVPAQLTMNGSLAENAEGDPREVTATWGESNENTLTISAKEETRDYSVGFVREDDNGLLSPIYVDCQKEMTIYSIDLDLGALSLAAKQGDMASEQRIVVWLTWTNAAPNNSTAANMTFWESLATKTAPFEIDSNGDGVSDITVNGYHFDVSGIPVTNENATDENGSSTGETTTVRVKQTFGENADGTAGELQTEYFHVETIEGDDGAYAHPLTKKEGQESIYYCDNADSPVYVNLANIDDTFEEKDVNMIRYDDTNTYAPIQQRAFGVSFSATFVQSSETP